MDFLKSVKWTSILISAAIALLGLIVLINPESAALSVCSLVGWVLIISGGLTLGAYFTTGKSSFVLTMALIQLLPGAYIVIRPDIMVKFVTLIMGLLLLSYGIATIRESVENRGFGYNHWWLSLAVGILTTVLSICVIINPFASASTVMIFAGCAMLVHGVSNIATIIVISNDMRKMM